MVSLIQRSQNKDARAVHLKLKRDASLTVSHSVEEADERHRTKTRHAEPVMSANPTRDAASPAGPPPG